MLYIKWAPHSATAGVLSTAQLGPISRPNQNQRLVYNGHKKVHALKFQSVVAPNGLIANLFDSIEGRRHESGMLADSGFLNLMAIRSFAPNGTPPLRIWGSCLSS